MDILDRLSGHCQEHPASDRLPVSQRPHDPAEDRTASRWAQPLGPSYFPTSQTIVENGDAHLAEQAAQKDHQEDIQRLLCLPDIQVPPNRRKQTPRQMSCSLMEHQKVCLTWLLQQEEDEHKKGGLLADTMGLGKTIQALSLILSRPSKDPLRKTTLIVAPLALLKQWEREIATKVKPQYKLKTVIFHGSKAKKMTVSQLLEHDVVLCTYGKLQHEYKIKYELKKKHALKILHHHAKFYRVILDEAHHIKNKDTKASEAAAEIRSQYRLCMTGTPFQNRVEEIFPLIRFLRISPYDRWQAFSEDIDRPVRGWNGDEQEAGLIKLQALIRSITLRRTKDSRLDGKPIVELRPRKDSPAPAVFDAEQRAFYDALETRQRLKFNKYLKSGTVMRNYVYVLVLLLRLRQVCDHPFLIKNHGIPEGAKLGADEMIRLAFKLPDDIVASIKGQKNFKCPLCEDGTENPIIIHPCGHYICPACFTASMAVCETEGGIGEEKSDGGSNADGRHETDLAVACPHDECGNEITPVNILCYNFFVDAHMGDNSGDDLIGHATEGDTFSEDTCESLDSFIVDSDDSDGAADDEDGSGWESDDNGYSRTVVKHEVGHVSTNLADNSMVVDDTSQDRIKGSREDPIEIESSNESSNSIKLTSDWRNSEMAKLKRLMEALENNEEVEDITKIQLQARPSDRKRPAGEVVTISRKKSRGEGPDHDIGSNKDRSHNKRGYKADGKYNRKKDAHFSLGQMKRDSQRNAAALSRYKQRLRKEWVPSCKIDKTMAILEGIRRRDPHEKTLIFSLWTSFLDLLEIPIEDAGIRYTRYDGSMRPDARDAAVGSFMDNPTVKVMLISLTAGNVGLNLTAATQIIILEPFWNPYVEEQAIGRAHRIGQKREVTVHRVLIANTVEDRILQLQERKKLLVDAALSERGARTVSRLGVQELRKLFKA